MRIIDHIVHDSSIHFILKNIFVEFLVKIVCIFSNRLQAHIQICLHLIDDWWIEIPILYLFFDNLLHSVVC